MNTINKVILVTGAGGMLGRSVCQVLADTKGMRIFGTGMKDVKNFPGECFYSGDLTDTAFTNILLKNIKPDAIIHCAAIVNVDRCEKEREYTYSLHVESTAYLSRNALPQTRFIYISTDSVYDGKKGNYSEEDVPNPLNYYAQTKLLGENISLLNNQNTLILRTNIYGLHTPLGCSFVEWALEEFSKNRCVKGFADVYFNPLYVGQLARIVSKLIFSEYRGVLNAASSDIVSKYAFLKELANVFGYSQELVKKSSVRDIVFEAHRPENTTLRIDKIKKYITEIPILQNGLAELNEDYNIIAGK